MCVECIFKILKERWIIIMWNVDEPLLHVSCYIICVQLAMINLIKLKRRSRKRIAKKNKE